MKPCHLFLGPLVLGVALTHAAAQNDPGPHEVRDGPYVLRSSVVPSKSIAAETARAHGIDQEGGHAILNVVVQRSGENKVETVPAELHVTTQALGAAPRDLVMEETSTNGYVAYTGTFDFLPKQVVDITVDARPRASDRTMRLKYRERMRQP